MGRGVCLELFCFIFLILKWTNVQMCAFQPLLLLCLLLVLCDRTANSSSGIIKNACFCDIGKLPCVLELLTLMCVVLLLCESFD